MQDIAKGNLKSKRIKDMPLSVRPREKLIASGRTNLTNAELVALLLNTGTAKKNAVALSEALLQKYPLDTLSQVSIKELAAISGIGLAKAARLAAALELGDRVFAPAVFGKVFVRSTVDAIEVLKEYANKKQEYLLALYLNARHELLQKEIVGLGTLNHMKIEPKDIFRHALATPCASLIVAHNHPSGDPTPSEDDVLFTKRLFEAGEIMGIPMLDHLIISRTGCYSFRNDMVEK